MLKPRTNPLITPTSGRRELDRVPARNAAREIVVKVRRLPASEGGGYRLVPVHADQHAVVARTLPELGRGMLSCFTEVELKAYARFKKQRPDLEVLTSADSDSFEEPLNRLGTVASPVLPPRSGHRAAGSWASGGKREQHPANYVANADGSWTSPKGKRFTAESMIHKIIRRRLAANLPIVPEGCVFDLSLVSEQIVRGARRDGQSPHQWLVDAVTKYGKPTPRRRTDNRDAWRAEVPGQLLLGMDLNQTEASIEPAPAPLGEVAA